MPNNTQYTRCPQCSTAFKVTAQMLAMAKGKVRCGACLQVFQADQHILQPRTKEQVAAATTNTQTSLDFSTDQTSENAQNSRTEAHQDPVFGDIDSIEPQTENMTTQADPQLNLKSEFDTDLEDAEDALDSMSMSALDDDSESAAEFDTDLDDAEDALDSMSMSTLNDDSESAAEFDTDLDDAEDALDSMSMSTLDDDSEFDTDLDDAGEALDSMSMSALDDDPDNIDEFDTDLIDTSDDIDSMYTGDEEEDINFEEDLDTAAEQLDSLLDFDAQPENETKPDLHQEPVFNESEFDSAEFEEIELSTHSTEEMDIPLNESVAKRPVEKVQISKQPVENVKVDDEKPKRPTLLSQHLARQITDTQPDPLEEFEGRVAKSNTGLRNLVIAVSIFILLGVAFAKFWSDRHALAWDDTWGSFTQSVCSMLPCDLEQRRDVSKIRIRQRVVTPSESQEKMLDVKLVMVNEAIFDQPYPTIIIRFSNSEGFQVAEKKFTPDFYFPAKQDQMMHAGSENHIAFTTELPHPDGLGFEFIFN